MANLCVKFDLEQMQETMAYYSVTSINWRRRLAYLFVLVHVRAFTKPRRFASSTRNSGIIFVTGEKNSLIFYTVSPPDTGGRIEAEGSGQYVTFH